ncbi:MFS transporter [Bacteroidia bacterium]|nr:MFS transporter [Bacteroidia bacterium]GHT70721.1 MFS transporter [Bacteroidia bacterium]
MEKQRSISKLLPVLFGFFVMGFCDVVGISSNYVKQDFNLSNTMANFLPFMVFIWFFIFSIPTGMMMNKLGRKKTVQLSNIITFAAMLIPFIEYSYYSCLLAFAFLGIANTILQVSLNPLLSNVVRNDQLTSSLTAGQFVKAVSSFSGPFIAAFAVSYFGNWQLMFPIFAGITFVFLIWLQLTPIMETTEKSNTSSFSEVWGLLKDKTIVLLFLGILFVVGVDVGINTVTPRILMERCGILVEEANYGVSVYFACRTAGAFIGAFILSRFSATKFFRIGMVIAMTALAGLFFVSGKLSILVLVGIIGFSCANVFSILFSIALRRMPEKANEVSGLMITGVAGGALLPVLMGLATDLWGDQSGAVAVISLCGLYLLICSFLLKIKREL